MFGGRASQQRHFQRESTDSEPADHQLRTRLVIAKTPPNGSGLSANTGLILPGPECPSSVQNIPPVVFVCYARINEPTVRKQLVPSLTVLANRNSIAPWLDTDLAPGEDWNETLQQRLSAAQIILFMVSRAFLASEYITRKERPLAMRLMDEKKAVVVPIILWHCSWNVEDFAKCQKLPAHVESISDVRPRENGWAQVEEGLVKVVENLPSHLANFPKREASRD